MSVSIALVRSLVDSIQRLGFDSTRFLAQEGFDASLLDNPSTRIDHAQFDSLQTAAIHFTRTPSLGLQVGITAPVAAYDIVGHLLLTCRSIREALTIFFRFYPLISDGSRSNLVEHGDQATVNLSFTRASPLLNRFRAEFVVAQVARCGQIFVGDQFYPIVVTFEHPQPEYMDLYRRFFQCELKFNQPRTSITFESRLLDMPQPHSSPSLFKMLTEEAERSLEKLSSRNNLATQIEAMIINEYQGQKPNLDSIAKQFNLSSRSLRRHLKQQGHSYGEITDVAQSTVAQRLLANDDLSVQEVAYRLGFSEPSSFHRAFKRWTGITPQQFRMQALANTAAA
ncbi:MAG TPA: AraC family transcriptional regulator [Pseudomonadales bacterium]|nr:AraC family transcriptional regulator [Pseudomonadales bacterium]